MSFREDANQDCAPEDLERGYLPNTAVYVRLTRRVASQNDLPGTNLTLRQLFLLVGGVATLVTVLNCCITFLSHFIWRTKYREQKLSV